VSCADELRLVQRVPQRVARVHPEAVVFNDLVDGPAVNDKAKPRLVRLSIL
jgi:hypothetical protein